MNSTETKLVKHASSSEDDQTTSSLMLHAPNRNWAKVPDRWLLRRVRGGSSLAFKELWGRHSTVVPNVMGTREEEIVQSVAIKAEVLLRDGIVPQVSFRCFLAVVALSVSSGQVGSQRLDSDSAPIDRGTHPWTESSSLMKSFLALPARQQEILWYYDVERLSAEGCAVFTGLHRSRIAARAGAARNELWRAWLSRQVADESNLGFTCRTFLRQIDKYVEGKLPVRDYGEAQRHVGRCTRCLIIAEQSRILEEHLRDVLIPSILGMSVDQYAAQIWPA